MVRPRSYHHGNLKEALVRAALELIRKRGPQGFTLREAARRAGVSHNAPYRHFRHRDELLAEVAADGFERLTKSLNNAAARGSNPLERFQFSGSGYVQFAMRFPEHFTVMFDRPEILKRSTHCKLAGQQAFAALQGFVRDCQNAGVLPTGDGKTLALMAWSAVHGVAKLAVSGHLPFSSRERVLEFTLAFMDTLAAGMIQTASKPDSSLPEPRE